MTTGPDQSRQQTAEERYVSEPRRCLADVPRRQRRALLKRAADDLGERPDAPTWGHLVADLGTPSSYAVDLRAEHGLPPHVGLLGHLAAWSMPTRLGIAVAFLAVTAAGVWFANWVTAEPEIWNSCSRVATWNSEIKVDWLEAAGGSEARIEYVDGAKVGLELCLASLGDVEILDIDMNTPLRSLFHQTMVRAAEMTTDPTGEMPVLDKPSIGPGSSGLRVMIEGRLADCEYYVTNGVLSFDSVEVRYRFRGRTRSTWVDTVTTYSFAAPPEDRCPRERA